MQEKVKELKKKLTQLEIEFGKNLSEEKSSFEFSEAELSKLKSHNHILLCCYMRLPLGGLSEDFIKSLSRTDDNKCVVTLKYPHCIPVAQKCTNPHTRATLECAFNSRYVCLFVCVCVCVCLYVFVCQCSTFYYGTFVILGVK